jgi:hypothetical protein
VGPVLKQAALLPQEAVEFSAVVVTQTAPGNEVMGALDDADGVELQTAEVADKFE